MIFLVSADLLLTQPSGYAIWGGVALWGLHMAMTQGLLWDQPGAPATFMAGAIFSIATLTLLGVRYRLT